MAHSRALAVVLVHHHRHMRIGFDGGLDQVFEEGLACVLARTGARLHDDRSAHFVSSLHDGLDLLQVVDIKSRDAVAVGGSVVQQFAH